MITMILFVALGAVVSLIASVADGGASMHNPFFCYSTDPLRSMAYRMSDMNSYENIRRFNFTTVTPYIPSGTPSRFWYLGREAARFAYAPAFQPMIDLAESSVGDDIVNNYESGRTSLCRPDLEAIRDFDKNTVFGSPLTIEKALTVMESGVNTMHLIARRFQQAIPNILTQNYSPDRFYFRHTSAEITNVSIRAFANGLFGDAGSQNVIYEDVPAIDWFLRPRDFCPTLSEELANSPDHRAAFGVGPEMEELVEQVNRRLGFRASNQLSTGQVISMWDFCRQEIVFETTTFETGANSTWCAAFSVGHHHLLEYYIDVGYFHRNGYGIRNQRLAENLNCGLIQDLMTHMQSNNNTDRMARIFVTDHNAFLSIFVSLGVFRDVWPLHQHNFAQQTHRRWNVSLIAPYNGNIAVVRYDSDDDDHDIIFLLNENPMLVPGCDQKTGVCKLSVLVNRFQRFINANCAVHFCSND